jgi:hypothetical protein
MLADDVGLILGNFGLFMFLLAVFFIALHKFIVRAKVSDYEIVYRWMALFPLGVANVYAFVIHAFYPEVADAAIGWSYSPFEYEVAMADLAFGMLAILSFNASFGFRLATVTGNVIYLMGDAFNHIYLMIVHGNYNPGNAGTWLWLDDLILPLIMLICINGLSEQRKA